MLLLVLLPLPLLANISFSSSIVFLAVPFWLANELASDVEIKQGFEFFDLFFERI